MKCNLGSGSSYLTQAKHILHRYSYSTLRIRLNYYGFHNSCNLLWLKYFLANKTILTIFFRKLLSYMMNIPFSEGAG